MLIDLPLDSMRKEDIIDHLETACCPVLKNLFMKQNGVHAST